VLVHHGQRLTEGPSGPIAVGRGGAMLAVTEFRPGPVVHAIDLVTGGRHTRPGTAVGVAGADVHLRDDDGSLRWRPGEEPERLPYAVEQVDPISGACLVRDAAGVSVVHPGGHRWPAPAGARMLLPGGERVGRLDEPLTVVLWDPTGRRSTCPLPPDPFRRSDRIRLAAWEDPHHLVYTLDVGAPGYVGLNRLDIRDGRVENIIFHHRVEAFVPPLPA
jgi:hypothetical protein